MHSKILLIFLFLVSTVIVSAQDSYRIKDVPYTIPAASAGKTDNDTREKAGSLTFIMPPGSKLNFYDNGALKEKYKYHFVYIKNLPVQKSGKYFKSLELLNQQTDYRFDEDENFKTSNLTEPPCDNTKTEPPCDNTKPKLPCDNTETICLSFDKTNGVEIRIDYSKFLTRTACLEDCTKKIITEFNDLTIYLLKEFYNREGEEENKWAKSISQSIVEKIFEMIPIPLESTLTRFGFRADSNFSFVLLNPQFSLAVDNVIKVQNQSRPRWEFNLAGQSKIQFGRDAEGSISQTPFLKLDPLPTNYIETDDEKNESLIASTSDIQLSGATNKEVFFAVYQATFKKNNEVPGDGNNECISSENKYVECNAVIISTKNLKQLVDCISYREETFDHRKIVRMKFEEEVKTQTSAMRDSFEKQKAELSKVYAEEAEEKLTKEIKEKVIKIFTEKDDKKPLSYKEELTQWKYKNAEDKIEQCTELVFSAFGKRNLITPTFVIQINSNYISVPLNSTLFNISTQFPMPQNIKVFRLHNGKYRKIEDVSKNLILLPGDAIKF